MTFTVQRGKGLVSVALVSALLLAACAPEEEAEFTEDQPQEEQQNDDDQPDAEDEGHLSSASDDDAEGQDEDVIYAEIDDPVTFEECEAAEDDESATVEWLDDVVVEEEEIAEAVPAETVEVDGEEVVVPGAPAIVVPERVGQAGCLIEYDAPGGCLPAVEISGSYLPGWTLEGRSIPEIELPDGTTKPALEQGELSAEAEHQEGDRAEEVCQLEDGEQVEEGDIVGGVVRGGIVRGGIVQGGEVNGGELNGGEILDSGDSFPGYSLPGYSVSGMSVPGASISAESLEGFVVEGTEGTERSGEDTVSYTTEGDVLFDSGEYELRPDAESELQAIVDDMADLDDQDFSIEVEGHTDDVPVTDGDRSYSDNQELSELRAEAVLDWLVGNAHVDSDDISSEGLGEDYPRADNSTDEGRQQNRRVVITVIPDAAEDAGIDYEVENGGDG